MPCPYTGSKMFFAGPNVLRQSKNLIAFSVSSKTFVSILLNANHLLVWHKKFGPDQNILGPVKGQGIIYSQPSWTQCTVMRFFYF